MCFCVEKHYLIWIGLCYQCTLGFGWIWGQSLFFSLKSCRKELSCVKPYFCPYRHLSFVCSWVVVFCGLSPKISAAKAKPCWHTWIAAGLKQVGTIILELGVERGFWLFLQCVTERRTAQRRWLGRQNLAENWSENVGGNKKWSTTGENWVWRLSWGTGMQKMRIVCYRKVSKINKSPGGEVGELGSVWKKVRLQKTTRKQVISCKYWLVALIFA